MRYSNDKDINDALNDAVKRYGCKVSVTGSCHLRITFPGGVVAFGPRTPGDRRAAVNFKAQLKRAARLAGIKEPS